MGQGRVVGQSPGGARPLPAVMWLAGAPLMASLIVVATAGLGEPGELCKQPGRWGFVRGMVRSGGRRSKYAFTSGGILLHGNLLV